MGTRYRKSIKVAPGVKVNVGKKSVGISVGNEYSGISVNSKTGAHARISAPGTGMSYTTKIKGTSEITDIPLSSDPEDMSSKFETSQISRRTNTVPQVEKPKNGKLNSVLNKLLIVTFSLLAIAVITLFIVNSYEKHYTNLAYEQYITELTSVLSELENSPSFRIEDSHVKIIIPSKLLNDPEFSKLSYCEDVQNTITATRNKWDILIEDPYVPVIFYDAQSNQIAIADSNGKIQVK